MNKMAVKRVCAVAVLTLGAAALIAAPDKLALRENLTTVENRFFKMNVSPSGGRVANLQAKFMDAELTDPSHGSFVEYDWMRRNRFLFRDKPFAISTSVSGTKRSVTVECGCQTGSGTDFLTITREYVLDDEATTLGVNYTFGNHRNAMSAVDYAQLIHATLGVSGCRCSYYFPSEDGIVEIERDKRPKDCFIDHPSCGWMAAVDDRGRGVALTIPFREVKSLFSWLSDSAVPTLEWRMIPISIEEGKSYAVKTEVIAFKGLVRVSGAGGGLVGEIADGRVRVYNSRAGKIVAKADGQTLELDFAEPGLVKDFASEATTVVLEVGGREVCRLEGRPKSGDWIIKPIATRRESAVKPYDLTGFTNFPHQVCRQFAKPLARKPRLIALTGSKNAVELGYFADRFDCEILTTQIAVSSGSKGRVIRNPQYDSGDYFAKVAVADIEENLVKTLQKQADAILVGGIPWEVFPKEAKKLLLEKVRSGTGLVWIGQDRDVPELFRTGLAKKPVTAVPAATGDDFADVPFALMGAEAVSAFKPTGQVLVKAGRAPYLTEDLLGKGRVLHLAYAAALGRDRTKPGLTPDLKDFYTDRAAPADAYYSLIAKCVLRAAGLELPVRLRATKADGERVSLAVDSKVAGNAMLEYVVCTPFGCVRMDGKVAVALTKGASTVDVPLADLVPYAKVLSFGAVLRDAGGRVLAWGDWTFEKPARAALVSLAADHSALKRSFYREGDTVRFTAEAKGETDGLGLVIEFTDAFGRTIVRQNYKAASSVEGSLTIANELPARAYDLVAKLLENGREIDRLRVEVRARPEPSKWIWDDFYFGIWSGDTLRQYLWPELEKRNRAMHLNLAVSTEMAAQVDFPMRHNLEPTYKAQAGIGRCGEPAAYAKTGDKMKLVRTPCLSDPGFLSRLSKNHGDLAKAFENIGMRFVWFGDEQSLTGKGSTSVDFCFSEHCLKEFRAWLQKRYGTLTHLNEEWEMSFADWDSVMPLTRQEVWADMRHVAAWADHLEFMDGRLAGALATCASFYRERDPNIRYSISGTQPPKAYGGMDWWRVMNEALDGALSYGTGGQFELHRSFRPDGDFMPWTWGYSRCGAQAVSDLWRTLFIGCRGIAGYAEYSIVNPDWSWSGPYAGVKPAMDRVAAGVGKYFIQCLKPAPQVAVLYSHPSVRAAFIESREQEHMSLRDKYIYLLRNIGVAFDLVSYQQLADGTFEKRGYRALVLPDAAAMSEAEIAAVKRFRQSGGCVVAEGVPARLQANCRPRAASPLTDLILWSKVDLAYLDSFASQGDPWNPQAAADASVKVIDAEQDRFEGILRAAGVRPSGLTLTDAASGVRQRRAAVYTREGCGGARCWGVTGIEAKSRDVDFAFDREGYLYDLVSEKALGFGRRFRLSFGQGDPRAFVLLPVAAELGDVTTEGARLTVRYTPSVETVVRVRVFAPKGVEAEHYARKIVVRDGQASYAIPFALSDNAGSWRVTVTDVLSGVTKTVAIDR